MAKCRDCSYEPAKTPKVFCPACGSVWDKAAPSKAPAKSKLGEGAKKEAAKKTTKKAAAKKGK